MPNSLTPKQVTQTVDASHDTIQAMLTAERFGTGMSHGATIVHVGYQSWAHEFNAATSLFIVRY